MNLFGAMVLETCNTHPVQRVMPATRMTRALSVGACIALALTACGDGGPQPPTPPGVISLAVGQGRTLTAAEAATIEVSGGPAGAEFVMVAFHGSQSGGATVALAFSASQVTAVVGPPSPQITPTTTPALSLESAASVQARDAERARFDWELRRIEREVLAPRIPAARAVRSLRASKYVAAYG
jgi:hypothetical protein